MPFISQKRKGSSSTRSTEALGIEGDDGSAPIGSGHVVFIGVPVGMDVGTCPHYQRYLESFDGPGPHIGLDAVLGR